MTQLFAGVNKGVWEKSMEVLIDENYGWLIIDANHCKVSPPCCWSQSENAFLHLKRWRGIVIRYAKILPLSSLIYKSNVSLSGQMSCDYTI